jgi:hypothetical protein
LSSRAHPVRRVVIRAALAAALVMTVLGILAVVSALSAARSLEQARAGLTSLRAGDAAADDPLPALRDAQRQVADADTALGRLPVDVIAALPLIGRSLDAERAVARTVREVLAAAVLAAERVPDLRAEAGQVDLAAVAELRSQLAGPVRRADQALQELQSTPTGLTPPQVGRGVAQAREALAPAVAGLQDAERGLVLAGGLLGGSGPRSLLVALENNAELRGTGGYVASFATGRLEDGRLALDSVRDVVAVADPPDRARRVPAPEPFQRDYGPLSGDTTLWRSWNMSPDVPDSALVGARVAGVLLGTEPDVVVLLDVPAMGALASLGGAGVSLPDGTTVSADDLTEALLVDAYAQAGAAGSDQLQRRADLQSAATEAVTRLLGSAVPAMESVRTLGRLATERHLKVWSARDPEQRLLEELGLAGAVEVPPGGDLVHVSVNNVGANKLDVYVDREVELEVVVGPSSAEVVQRVRFTNRAPEGLVPYVAGVQRPGTVVSRVELSVPPRAQDVAATVDGQPWLGSDRQGTSRLGPDRRRLAIRVELPRGASTQLEIRYTLPIEYGRYLVRVLPQPLAQDAALQVSIRPAAGERFGDVTGVEVEDGGVSESSPLTASREIEVTLHRPQQGRWERLRDAVADFWSSPVEIG